MDAPSPAEEAPPGAVTAPRVELVIVAHEPGAWFEETLSAAAAQDYPRLDMTVLAAGGEATTRAMVAASLPATQIRVIDPDQGFGRSANSVLDETNPPAFYLFCHDDTALAPEATRLLVEESMRSNASIVGPKIVAWDRSTELLEVGLDIDKLGHVAARVDVGELDQEQHDSVTDVFAVSAAALLVRADLFRALEGFDGAMGMTGEDVDLCWRAHVAGARVMVVPSAVARHRVGLIERHAPNVVERVQERHRLRAVLSNYGVWHSLRVVPQAVVFTLLRAIGALLSGHFGRARALAGAWGWNLARPGSLRQRRKSLRRLRQLPDREIRRLQVGGFAPLTTFLRGQLAPDHVAGSATARLRGLLDSLRAGPSRVSTGLWAAIIVVFAFGSRHLLTRGVPVVGDLATFDLDIGGQFSAWFDSWSSTGLGHEATAPTAHGLVGFAGVLFLGSMGLLRTVLTVGMIPIGAIGIWRLLRPFESVWIRAVGTAMYVVTPVPYNALGHGSWSGLLLFGSLPWVLAGLGRAGRVAPFGSVGGRAGPGVYQPSWPREVLGLGLLLGALVAFVPLAAGIVVLLAVLLVVGSVLAGWPSGAGRLIAIALGATAVAGVLNIAWLLDAVADGARWSWVVGTRPEGGAGLSLADSLRLQSGSLGSAPLGWAMPIAALVPLLLGRGERWAWAVRGLVVYLGGVAAVWMSGESWFPSTVPRPEVLLAPAALGLAIAVAMGAGAIHRDLRTYHFGWRQLVPLTAVAAIALAVLPVLGASFSGYWRMPDEELDLRLAQSAVSQPAAGRVLWIGHDDVLAAAGQPLRDGLTMAVTSGLTSTFADRWAGGDAPAADLLDEAVDLAFDGGTSRLGRLLAPLGISDVVVVERLAPLPASGPVEPVPPDVLAALSEQLDLDEIKVAPGIVRYRNTSTLGVAALVPVGATAGRTVRAFASASEAVVGSVILLPSDGSENRFEADVTADGEVFAAFPTDSPWRLSVDGVPANRGPALEWALAFRPQVAGHAVLEHRTPAGHQVVVAFQAALWFLAVVAVVRYASGARGLSR